MYKLEIRNLTKKFGEVIAIDDISLGIKEGELVVLLGPSGCGKTTTLRCIAGLTRPDRGEILLEGKLLSSSTEMIPPHKRDLSMVFQSYALWPHKTVFENIVYGLRLKKISPSMAKTKVKQMLNLLRISGLEERYPSELSGGQQQRVAVARALVREPSLLLFDEPLSNLDAALREEMRFEIRSLQKKLGITSVYVTHDQQEAMAIGDKLVVMKNGKIKEIGTPQQIYTNSRSKFVASFIGIANIVDGQLKEIYKSESLVKIESEELRGVLLAYLPPESCTDNFKLGQRVSLFIRPEWISCQSVPPKNKPNTFLGRVVGCSYLGEIADVKIKLNSGKALRVRISAQKMLRVQEKIYVHFDPKDCKILLSE